MLLLISRALQQFNICDRRDKALCSIEHYQLTCSKVTSLAEDNDVGIKDQDSVAFSWPGQHRIPMTGYRVPNQKTRDS